MNQHVDKIEAAYADFTETTRHIWQGQDRPLTTEECEQYAQATAIKYGLEWKWNDEDGIVFSPFPQTH